jgi:outer membrane protein assembly factor BamA
MVGVANLKGRARVATLTLIAAATGSIAPAQGVPADAAPAAQTLPPDRPPAPAQPTDATGAALPVVDAFDLLRKLFNKPPAGDREPGKDDYKRLMIAAAPVVGYNPANGASAGVAGDIAFFRGEPATTRISSLVTSLTLTTKDQLHFNAKFNVLTAQDRWDLVSDNRVYLTNEDTYDLGTNTPTDQGVNVQFDYLRLYQTAYRQVHHNLFVGPSLLFSHYTHIKPNPNNPPGTPESAYTSYSTQNGFDLETQTSAGTAVNALFENRDSAIDPTRGFYASLGYRMYFKGFLDGTSNWQLFRYDLRTYVRLTKDARHKLAFWLFGNLITGGTAPYFDLPTTGGDTYGRSGRGYTQGRFRGQRMVYGEVEYRWTLTRNGLLGMVAFLNTETLSNEQTGEKLFDSFATGFGAGLRLMLNKGSRTNLCLDYGRGKDGSHGVYFGVQEAF